MRSILLFLLLLLGIYYARRLLSKPADRARPQGTGAAKSERMVECAHCGLLVPESEAVTAGGRTFCSTEHKRLHRDPAA